MEPIKEVFSQFCKERHEEDGGKNFDTLQEIYSKTEFFDLVFCKDLEMETPLKDFSMALGMSKGTVVLPNFSIPFPNMFMRIREDSYVFIREYEPNVYTGTYYMEMDKSTVLNCPFTIRVNEDTLNVYSDFYVPSFREEYMEVIMNSLFGALAIALKIINTLSKKTVVKDTPKNPSLCEYYRRKKSPTIKIPQRPIYYILEKEEEQEPVSYFKIRPTGKLEYSYAFRVRGHWRRISEKSYGKDRNGEYNVIGYTWVTDYIKGDGELAQRLRVIK